MSSATVKLAVVFSLSLLVFCGNASSFCFDEAGAQYGVNPLILRAIAKEESDFDPAAVNVNSNGTVDYGLMQINSIWRPVLGEERWKALGDACYNTKTGAWILAKCIDKYGYNWKAVGCYNSQTPEISEQYAKRVFKHLKQLEKSQKEESARELEAKLKDIVANEIDDAVTKCRTGEVKKIRKKFVPYVKLSRDALKKPPPPPARDARAGTDSDADGLRAGR